MNNIEKFTELLIECWKPFPKTKLKVSEWKEEKEGEVSFSWCCAIETPSIGEGRALNMITGIGGIQNLLKDITREAFITDYEVIYNNVPYDAGKFWDITNKIV